MVRFYLLLLLTVSSLAAFAQTKPTSTGKTASNRAAASPKTYTGRVIAVTNGGGFTGRSVSYYLQDDGRLYGKRSSEATYTALGKQTKANTKRVFWSLEDRCKIKTTQFDSPGNTYKSVTWQKDKERYNVTWGSPKDSVPANYEQFYKSFMTMIPASLQLK